MLVAINLERGKRAREGRWMIDEGGIEKGAWGETKKRRGPVLLHQGRWRMANFAGGEGVGGW